MTSLAKLPRIERGLLVVDPGRCSATWAHVEHDLSYSECVLMHMLADRPGQYHERGTLMDAMGIPLDADPRAIDHHIKRLRRKFPKNLFLCLDRHGYKIRQEMLMMDAAPAMTSPAEYAKRQPYRPPVVGAARQALEMHMETLGQTLRQEFATATGTVLVYASDAGAVEIWRVSPDNVSAVPVVQG